MQLILEKWDSFLAENADGDNIARRNAQKILEISKIDTGTNPDERWQGKPNGAFAREALAEMTGLSDQGDESDEEFLKRMLDITTRVPTLRESEIKKLLGVGTLGVVFAMQNDRALKLFERTYGSDTDSFYQIENAKIFDGKGQPETMPIFDSGTVRLPNGKKIKFAEMAKVIPFLEYFQTTGRIDDTSGTNFNRALERMRRMAFQFVNKIKTREQLVHKLKDEVDLYLDLGFTAAEFVGIFEMLIYMIKTHGFDSLLDMHIANFGVIDQTIGRNPKFVLFDP